MAGTWIALCNVKQDLIERHDGSSCFSDGTITKKELERLIKVCMYVPCREVTGMVWLCASFVSVIYGQSIFIEKQGWYEALLAPKKLLRFRLVFFCDRHVHEQKIASKLKRMAFRCYGNLSRHVKMPFT
jgi:hypothetical protein